MLTKAELIERLDRSLEIANIYMETKDKDRPSIHIMDVEMLEFNLEESLIEWAKEKEINFVVVDIPQLTEQNIQALPEDLSIPTVFLLKNWGDFAYDTEIEYLRSYYRSLVKDCRYGWNCVFANNFLFAVVTTTKDKPIRDMSESCGLCLLNQPTRD